MLSQRQDREVASVKLVRLVSKAVRFRLHLSFRMYTSFERKVCQASLTLDHPISAAFALRSLLEFFKFCYCGIGRTAYVSAAGFGKFLLPDRTYSPSHRLL